ncbi:uncharacterized protein LOC122963036 [Acropora millepora]|uniref:uncharacterized protein LOC122963036 n=1 Tax=Acropora millepora TaxID=45264 RepID=UPI001CF27BE9|nr:uncharacterized protein LOC122963036 [Acropora millepora]
MPTSLLVDMVTSESHISQGNKVVQHCHSDDFSQIAKYGKGKLQERVCPKCEYKSEIQTPGVYVLGNGCIKVYSEDDEFQCPRCGFTEDVDDPKEGQSEQDLPLEQSKEKKEADTGEEKKANKKRKLPKQAVHANIFADLKTYQNEADEKFSKLMEEQGKEEFNLRKQELQAYTDSMALLARAISGQNTIHTQQYVYNEGTSQTLFRL